MEVTYDVNDLLVLVLLLRTTYSVRLIIVLTKFFGDRADRVSKMMGYDLSMFFSIRCLIIKYPIQMLSFLSVLTASTLAFMVHIIESPVYAIETKDSTSKYFNDYRDYNNCLWNMLVTMTTGKPFINLSRLWRLLPFDYNRQSHPCLLCILRDHPYLTNHRFCPKLNKLG